MIVFIILFEYNVSAMSYTEYELTLLYTYVPSLSSAYALTLYCAEYSFAVFVPNNVVLTKYVAVSDDPNLTFSAVPIGVDSSAVTYLLVVPTTMSSSDTSNVAFPALVTAYMNPQFLTALLLIVGSTDPTTLLPPRVVLIWYPSIFTLLLIVTFPGSITMLSRSSAPATITPRKT